MFLINILCQSIYKYMFLLNYTVKKNITYVIVKKEIEQLQTTISFYSVDENLELMPRTKIKKEKTNA